MWMICLGGFVIAYDWLSSIEVVCDRT